MHMPHTNMLHVVCCAAWCLVVCCCCCCYCCVRRPQEAFTVQKKLHTLDRLAWSDMFETFLANK
jgi:hypothetical protein